jgi:hypothetical protein
MLIKYLPPARMWALVEAIVACVLVFLDVTIEQGAAVMAVAAVATGEVVHTKTK